MITSAAMIMVSVFLAFVINGDPTVKQFGLGMAAAVAVDATVVRCVLVPAIMALLGSAGWWMPAWLERVTPKFSIEGNEWFAEHATPPPRRRRRHTNHRSRKTRRTETATQPDLPDESPDESPPRRRPHKRPPKNRKSKKNASSPNAPTDAPDLRR